MAPSDELSSELTQPRFVVLDRAGRGGSADVWRAEDTKAGGVVALKLARGDEGRAALAREAGFAALSLSPRLPELVQVGWASRDGRDGAQGESTERVGWPEGIAAPPSDGPWAYVALRWVEGERLVPEAPRSPEARLALALSVACSVGEALADLHALAIAHGDVKPQNIVVQPDGRATLIDLGLAGDAGELPITGATPRYLATGDVDLGDARTRDRLALGVVLAEILSSEVASAPDAVSAARSATLPEPFDAICAALLAPSPGARPSAAWVSDLARDALGRAKANRGEERAERDARLVRGAYLRLRRHAARAASSASDDAAPWLAEAIEGARRIASIDPQASAKIRAGAPLERLDVEGVARWLTSVVGVSAASWPLAKVMALPEAQLASGWTALARQKPPAAWTLDEVERAAAGEAASPALARDHEGPLDARTSVEVALAIRRVPSDPAALSFVERRRDASVPLVLAAADALRLRGELGRARALCARVGSAESEGAALTCEILRRAGDVDEAAAMAASAIARGADPAGRARAVLCRIRIDAGRLDEASTLLEEGAGGAALAEARALVASLRGDVDGALDAIARGLAVATTAEERSRLSGLRGYVLHARDSEASRVAYASAVDDAVRAGAVLEEATYRTGEAAAAVDIGDLGQAIATSRRAALLWEHLGKPAQAARARLAIAAAYATAGAAHEATRAAALALESARAAGDRRAEAYAWWAVCDVSPRGSDSAIEAAAKASELLAGAGADDALQAGARALLHDASAPKDALDKLAAEGAASAAARLAWWGARARDLATRVGAVGAVGEGERPDAVLSAITSLLHARAPIGVRGPAFAAGADLAARAGKGEIAQRLLAAVGDAARDLSRRASPELASAIAALPWVARSASSSDAALAPEQVRDLEALVRSLGEERRLGALLRDVVDALVLWTGVERGVLLMRAPDDRLVPRAARNLARADLTGEQLALSRSLSARALAAREPVVAVDAAGELGSVHDSIHALKLRSVLAVPLIARGEALGVVYLDDRMRRGAFGPRELAFARTIASIAAVAILDARDQVLLKRAARKARRASEALAETLARREAALDVAERELARVKDNRPTRFRYEKIVGESEAVREMLGLVDRVTASDIPVLLIGESGSGKELVARAIHENGERKSAAFVGENCGAIPETLLESALFGHVRGAFTGADRPRAGLFEAADKGTLFLDEVGEMSLPMQAKLLRVLEDGVIRPLGTERTRKVSVRVIAATHRDLRAMVAARTFREDLLYRLDIVTIRVPPLRERASDIPLLIRRFVATHGGGKRPQLTDAALERLCSYAWPGNIRQLENEIRRAIVLSDGVIDAPHLSRDVAGAAGENPRELGLHVRRRIDALEGDLVREALKRTGNNQTQAAKLLGLSRFGLQKMIKRLAIT